MRVGATVSGEQAVFPNAKWKGLVVLSACADRGIVNTARPLNGRHWVA